MDPFSTRTSFNWILIRNYEENHYEFSICKGFHFCTHISLTKDRVARSPPSRKRKELLGSVPIANSLHPWLNSSLGKSVYKTELANYYQDSVFVNRIIPISLTL